MAEHHSESLYHKIFWYLLVLTILEIIVALVPFARLVKGILLVGMALGKAALVAMFFMHLKYDWFKLYFIVFPVVILTAMMVIVLLPDTVLTWHEGQEHVEQPSGGPH